MTHANESNAIPLREHHFYVATAKHVFTHKKHGLVFVRDPISITDAAQYGMQPLILYGVTVPKTTIMWLTFSPANAPRSFTSILQDAWTQGNGLRGKPDILKINQHVSAACPDLTDCLAEVGVEVVIADGKDRVFSASLRTAQIKSAELDHHYRALNAPPVTDLENLISSARDKHHWDTDMVGSFLTGDQYVQVALWLALPVHPLPFPIPEANWTPGPWLSAWEANLPPQSPRFFTKDTPKWLILGRAEDFEDVTSDDEFLVYEPESPLEAIKLMMSSWPNTVTQIAQEIGIKGKELQWFLSSRKELEYRQLHRLLKIFSIDMRRGYYQATGPCVLIARVAQSIARAYEELCNGGDIDFSFEAVPDKGIPDPSWMYLVFQACCGKPSIIMIPRGSKVSEQFNSGLFINFEGQKQVPASVYRDIVRTTANACTTPSANYEEMVRFMARQDEYLRLL